MERTRAELSIMHNTKNILMTIARELSELIRQCPALTRELSEIDKHADTIASLEEYIDTEISHRNYLDTAADPDSKNGYSTKYDMRSVGSYLYTWRDEDGRHETYKENILDKFHTLVSLMFYELYNLPKDYQERDIVIPVSACDPRTQNNLN